MASIRVSSVVRRDFDWSFDRYLEIEKGLNATYFFIPFKGLLRVVKNRSGAAGNERQSMNWLEAKTSARYSQKLKVVSGP